MAEKLTGAEWRVLVGAPFIGFVAGSNMWPLVWLDFDDNEETGIDGEVVDGLLRRGLLASTPLDEPVLTDKSPDTEIIPDCECTHDIMITPAGRAVLTQTQDTHEGIDA